MVSRTAKIRLDCAVSGRTKPLVPKKKVKSFITLFDIISKRLKSIGKAEDYCGLSHATIYALRDKGFLTSDSARKILDAYNKIIKEVK